ncbi:hypothetical protein H9X85_02320 [Anaerotignum lactatifermentans]|uniref:Uncharacterized protein n=1 Tax=Anaerotignum lactatifermentans TaxID=160404 RepID=A0ABS2G8S2_9FIRM|nr:hypothetical protein [Anaerotignum lactatifermentans]MBM6828467.1 hypothetical protein [Anaerotignum lactatifermentans]MBM6877874.1 hypothetical protein [Anaerotignum lactatifermentans]MBM6950050.1 hypothetical protein [Anaerotignum lactatifermentans]
MDAEMMNPQEDLGTEFDDFLENEADADTLGGGGDPESMPQDEGEEETQEPEVNEEAEENQEPPAQEDQGKPDDAEFQRRMEDYGKQCVDKFIQKQFGDQVNPFTGRPIRTVADYEAYRQQYEEKRLRDALEGVQMAPELREQILRDRRTAAQSQEYMRQQQERETKEFTRTQLEELAREYPESNIKSLADLAQTPSGKRAIDLWTKGVSLKDAYSVAFQKEIAQGRTRAAKQQALNEANSKGHIAQPKGGERQEEVMSKEDLQIWRNYYPNKSDQEIRKIWKQNR